MRSPFCLSQYFVNDVSYALVSIISLTSLSVSFSPSLSLFLSLPLVQSLLASRVISTLRAKAHKSESARIVSLRKLAHLLCGDAGPRSLLAAEAAAQRLAASGEGCVVDAGAGIRVRLLLLLVLLHILFLNRYFFDVIFGSSFVVLVLYFPRLCVLMFRPLDPLRV